MDVQDAAAVDDAVDLQGAQGVQHQLTVVLRLHGNAGAVFVVAHAQLPAADQDAVGGAKAAGGVVAVVHSVLQRHEGGPAEPHSQVLQVVQVHVRGGVHALVVAGILLQLLQPGIVGTGAHRFEEIFPCLQLRYGVGQGARRRVGAAGIRELCRQLGRRRAVEPPGGAAGGEPGMLVG